MSQTNMAEVALKNLLRLHKPSDEHDALVLAVHALLTENGFRCIGSGEQVFFFAIMKRKTRFQYKINSFVQTARYFRF